jgi:hypothetical protein
MKQWPAYLREAALFFRVVQLVKRLLSIPYIVWDVTPCKLVSIFSVTFTANIAAHLVNIFHAFYGDVEAPTFSRQLAHRWRRGSASFFFETFLSPTRAHGHKPDDHN